MYNSKNKLTSLQIETPLGDMLAIANNESLLLLEFLDKKNLEKEIKEMEEKTNASVLPGTAAPLDSIEFELKVYFNGKLKEFKTPVAFFGTDFQQSVWEELRKIPFGETCSYADLAKKIGKPTAFRAVANANGANKLSIIVPCHRVINTNGKLGGYAGGIMRKDKLITLESSGFLNS